MEKNRGCFLFLLISLSFWTWVIMAFIDVSSCLGGLVGILLTFIFWAIFRKKNIMPKFTILFVFGAITAAFINLLIGIVIWVAILSAIGMVLNVVSVLRFFYEARL